MVSAAGPLCSVGTDRENDPLSPQNPYTEKNRTGTAIRSPALSFLSLMTISNKPNIKSTASAKTTFKNSKLVDFQKILPFVLQYNLSKKVLQYSYQYYI